MNILQKAEQIFEQGNKWMKNLLRFFGGQSNKVVKYIVSKLRKYSGNFFESNKTIAESCDCSVSTVQRIIQKLVKAGMIVVTPQYKETFEGKMQQTSNLIQMLPFKEYKQNVTQGTPRVEQPAQQETVQAEVAPEAQESASNPSYDYLGVFAQILEESAATPAPVAPEKKKKQVKTEMIPDWLKGW